MKKSRLLAAVCLCLFCFTTISTKAALIPRLGGQAYYDTVLDITWLADANLSSTSHFGVSEINLDGRMTWVKTAEWLAGMNTDSGVGYLGINTWRLPYKHLSVVRSMTYKCLYVINLKEQ